MRERLEARAQFELHAFERLSDVFATLLGESSLETMLEAVADAVDALVPSTALLLFRLDAEREVLVPLVARGPVGRRLAEIEPSAREGLLGRAVTTGEPILDNSPVVSGASGDAAVVVVPLLARGSVKGCLAVYRGEGASFTDAEFRFVARFSHAAALALDNEETRSRLATLAHTDELTGVLNRRGFYEALDRELAQARRAGAETSVLVVDVDGLKRINDRYGHDVGDAVLARTASLLSSRLRAGDFVGRMGGDEFAVGLAATTLAAARDVAQELEEMLAHTVVTSFDAAVVARATIGVATVDDEPETARAALRRADLDMYDRKATRARHAHGEPAEPGASAASGHEAVSGT